VPASRLDQQAVYGAAITYPAVIESGAGGSGCAPLVWAGWREAVTAGSRQLAADAA